VNISLRSKLSWLQIIINKAGSGGAIKPEMYRIIIIIIMIIIVSDGGHENNI